MTPIRFLGLFIVFVCGATVARAEQQSGAQSASPLFVKGTWDLEAFGGYAGEFYPYDHVKFATGSMGMGYFIRDNFAVSLQVPAYFVQQTGPDAEMFGLNLSLRDHFFQRGKMSLYGDLVGGLAEASHRVPPGGTQFNFTLQGGVGATYQLTHQLHAVVGVHLFHLSNAAIRGINRNPDLNSVEGYAGLMLMF